MAEQLVLVNILRHFERTETLEILRDTAFVIDGPLAIFGMPAWLKTYVGNEIARIHNNCQQRGDPGILLMGVEKSGDFLEHLKMLDWEPGEGPGSNLPNCTAFAPDLKLRTPAHKATAGKRQTVWAGYLLRAQSVVQEQSGTAYGCYDASRQLLKVMTQIALASVRSHESEKP